MASQIPIHTTLRLTAQTFHSNTNRNNPMVLVAMATLLPMQAGSSSASLQERYLTSLLLEPRSLVVVANDMYMTYLHGIAERSEDVITEHICNLPNTQLQHEMGSSLQRRTRVSLTIRHVPKVTKFKFLGR